MKNKTRIVVDAMGGDNAPEAVVKGSVEACTELGVEVILTGKADTLKSCLKKLNPPLLPITIHDTPEVVTMHDNPVDVLKKKKNSSIGVGLELLRDKKADAFISAGNSGAVAAGAVFILKRLTGIDRPAIITVMPVLNGYALVLDAGATNTCKPHNLVQFAIMGSVYCKHYLKIHNPRVGLLSNGEEDTKGTEILKKTNNILKQTKTINYKGFAEGGDVFKNKIDVIVCDGFTGNVFLKVAEGVMETMGKTIRQELDKGIISKIGGLFAKSMLEKIKKTFHYAEVGGAPLIGVNGPVIISHGRSNHTAIKSAIRAARDYANSGVIDLLSTDIDINHDIQSFGKRPMLDKMFH